MIHFPAFRLQRKLHLASSLVAPTSSTIGPFPIEKQVNKDTVNRQTWWAIGTRNGGEVVSSDQY